MPKPATPARKHPVPIPSKTVNAKLSASAAAMIRAKANRILNK